MRNEELPPDRLAFRISDFGFRIFRPGTPNSATQGRATIRVVSDDFGELSASCEKGGGAQRSSEGALFGRALRVERFEVGEEDAYSHPRQYVEESIVSIQISARSRS